MSEFSDRLRALRRSRGISQRVVAGELHISQALLSHYEKGIREPGFDFVNRVCDYYNVTADDLLGRKSPETPAASFDAVPASPGALQFQQAAAFLWHLLEQTGDPELLRYGQNYFGTVIYKLSRHLLSSLGDGSDRFQVAETDYALLADADLSLTELLLLRQLRNASPLRETSFPQGQQLQAGQALLFQADSRLRQKTAAR